MKKVLTLLFGGLIALTLFVSTGNTAKAAGECGCNALLITGSERNKIVSELLKSDGFKNKKMELKEKGYTWNGAKNIEVINLIDYNAILTAAAFTNNNGEEIMFIFKDGKFLYSDPMIPEEALMELQTFLAIQ
ncbi:hypothetical protein ACIFOT_06480 [Neobacillus sp. NRS-1170]|uniref:hypothetical protein n=1 Tax=Neobacillus sp. NRS-1170 TaxID=3233898 RepID=UPI003D2D4908